MSDDQNETQNETQEEVQNQDPRFLDLDALAPEIGVSITLKGKNHKMAEMSVQDFVWAQKLAGENKELDPENMKDEDFEYVMTRMIDVLARQFPTCEREDIAGLPISKLTALIKFTGQLGAEGAVAAVVGAAEEGKVELVEEKPTSQ